MRALCVLYVCVVCASCVLCVFHACCMCVLCVCCVLHVCVVYVCVCVHIVLGERVVKGVKGGQSAWVTQVYGVFHSPVRLSVSFGSFVTSHPVSVLSPACAWTPKLQPPQASGLWLSQYPESVLRAWLPAWCRPPGAEGTMSQNNRLELCRGGRPSQ